MGNYNPIYQLIFIDMKIFFSFFLSTFLIMSCIAQKVSKTTYRLPDGTLFEHWHDKTEYSKTFYVNKHHPQASDNNPGSFHKPFETISHAADLVKAGEKVQPKLSDYAQSTKKK